ncbi:MAG TPA: efflux RND transporter periplasmic adaptor subunit, partial [Polyangia bacterium]|nr:efflux RND transporter periplasmic adaptor subunit [Polyangia bacterium]
MSGPKEPDSRDDAGEAADKFGRRAYDHDPSDGDDERPPGRGYGRRDYDQPRDRNDDRDHHSHEGSEDRRDSRDRNDDRDHHSRAGGEDRRDAHGQVERDRSGKRHDDRKRDDDRQRDGDDRAGKPPGKRDEERSFRGLGIALVIAVLIGALGAGALFYRHHHRLAKERKARESQVSRGPRIFYSKVDVQPAQRELTVTADVRGFSQATLYAKVSGYVKSIAVDKGDHVHEGQLIGVLESPEVDQQVAAAEADLVIKKRTFERYQKLVAKDFVSAQDFETARAQYGVSEAQLRQMKALQSYETLRAPFAGTVTARYVDPGALVPAATGSTQSALPLVDIADLRRLRITVFVQQDAAPFLHVGDPVTITVDERPDLKIRAVISRFARALDTRSRMMLCEVWIDNTANLYPGTFVHVKLQLQGQKTPQVPSAALLLHDNKPAVALIRDGKVKFVTVRPGIDDGHFVQILDGVEPGDQVALSLPAEIPDGATVQPVEQKKAQ